MLTADQAREIKWLREKRENVVKLCEQGAQIVTEAIQTKHQAELKVLEAMHLNSVANAGLTAIQLQIEYLEACDAGT